MKEEQLNRDSKKYFLSTDLYDNKIPLWEQFVYGQPPNMAG